MTSNELTAAMNEVAARLFPHRPKGMLRIADDMLVLGLYLVERMERRRTPDLKASKYDQG